MRIVRFVLIFSLGFLSAAPAAVSAQAGVVGIKAGVSSSSASFDFRDGVPTTVTSEGLEEIGGGFARVRLRSRLALQLEVLRSRKGFDRSNPALDLTYLEFPILLRFAGSDPVAPFVYLGTAPAYQLGCRVSYETADGPRDGDCDSVMPFGRSEATRNYDLSAVAGAGITGSVRRVEWDLDVRYTYGLTDIREAAERAVNRSAAVTAGIAVPLF